MNYEHNIYLQGPMEAIEEYIEQLEFDFMTEGETFWATATCIIHEDDLKIKLPQPPIGLRVIHTQYTDDLKMKRIHWDKMGYCYISKAKMKRKVINKKT